MAKIVQARAASSAPQKTPAALAIQLFAVFGAPAAWSLQLLIDYALAADACFPNDAPLREAAFAWDRPALIAFNLAALALAALAAGTALRLRRRSVKGRDSSSNECPMEIARGRSHFMAACGLLIGFGFMAAILFNTVAAVGVPQCSG